MADNDLTWESFILTFPFWIFVKTQPTRTPELAEGESTQVIVQHDFKVCYDISNWHGRAARVYLRFRSAPANYLPMPIPKSDAIPFEVTVSRFKPDIEFPRLAVIPLPALDQGNEPCVHFESRESWRSVPEPFPMDSMRIDIQGEKDRLGAANELATLILRHIRIETEQWWITRSVDALTTYLQVTFKTDSKGNAASYPKAYGQLRGLWGFERPLTPEVWPRVIESAINDVILDSARELLMDAYFKFNSEDLDGAVLFAAMACETAVEKACFRVWERKAGSAAFRRSKALPSGNNLPDNLSKDLRRMKRDFSEEDPQSFEQICDLWFARGAVAHGNHACIRRAEETRQITAEEAHDLLRATRKCFAWLDTL